MFRVFGCFVRFVVCWCFVGALAQKPDISGCWDGDFSQTYYIYLSADKQMVQKISSTAKDVTLKNITFTDESFSFSIDIFAVNANYNFNILANSVLNGTRTVPLLGSSPVSWVRYPDDMIPQFCLELMPATASSIKSTTATTTTTTTTKMTNTQPRPGPTPNSTTRLSKSTTEATSKPTTTAASTTTTTVKMRDTTPPPTPTTTTTTTAVITTLPTSITSSPRDVSSTAPPSHIPTSRPPTTAMQATPTPSSVTTTPTAPNQFDTTQNNTISSRSMSSSFSPSALSSSDIPWWFILIVAILVLLPLAIVVVVLLKKYREKRLRETNSIAMAPSAANGNFSDALSERVENNVNNSNNYNNNGRPRAMVSKQPSQYGRVSASDFRIAEAAAASGSSNVYDIITPQHQVESTYVDQFPTHDDNEEQL